MRRRRRRNPTTIKCPSCGAGNRTSRTTCWDPDCGSSLRGSDPSEMFFGTKSAATSRTGFISRYGRRYHHNPEDEVSAGLEDEVSTGPVDVVAPAEPMGLDDEVPLLEDETPAEAARRRIRRRRNPECPECVCDPCVCDPCPECVCDPCECPSASRNYQRNIGEASFGSIPMLRTTRRAPCFECGKTNCGCGCGGDQDLCVCTAFRLNPCGTDHSRKRPRSYGRKNPVISCDECGRRFNYSWASGSTSCPECRYPRHSRLRKNQSCWVCGGDGYKGREPCPACNTRSNRRANPMRRTTRWAPCFECGKANCGCGCGGDASLCLCPGTLPSWKRNPSGPRNPWGSRRRNPLVKTSRGCAACGKINCGCGCNGDPALCTCTGCAACGMVNCGCGCNGDPSLCTCTTGSVSSRGCAACGKVNCGCGCNGNPALCTCATGSVRSRGCVACGKFYCNCGCNGNPALCTCTAQQYGRSGGRLQSKRWARGGVTRRLSTPAAIPFRSRRRRYRRNS